MPRRSKWGHILINVPGSKGCFAGLSPRLDLSVTPCPARERACLSRGGEREDGRVGGKRGMGENCALSGGGERGGRQGVSERVMCAYVCA